MPLSSIVHNPAPRSVGNAITIGGVNLPYRTDESFFFNYSLTGSDYHAGAVQFLYETEFTISLDPLGGFGSFNGNPIRQVYGEVALANQNNRIIRHDILQYQNQSIQHLGAQHRLSRQEASRPKQFGLAERPRAITSSSALQQYLIQGRFLPPAMVYQGGGTLTTPPNPFTESGTITPGGTNAPTLDIPRREWVMDMTDGRLRLTQLGVDPLYYPSANYNNLTDNYRPSRVYLYLLPGATGTIKNTVYKLTEPSADNSNYIPEYVSSLTFPAL